MPDCRGGEEEVLAVLLEEQVLLIVREKGSRLGVSRITSGERSRITNDHHQTQARVVVRHHHARHGSG